MQNKASAPDRDRILVETDRLAGELATLARISEAEPPVVTRVVFSEADLRARAYLKQLAKEANLAIREDAAGNTFFRWPGSEPDLPAVATGSHIDAIPNAGAYDGTVGVLGGLEAIRALQRSGFQPRRSIELIQFTSEEPTRFGIGCLGSRLMAGTLSQDQLHSLRDQEGKSLNELRNAAGFTGDLASVAIPAGHYSAFVELHIEQGPILENEGLDIGIVTHIAAPASLRIQIQGEGGHAGAMLMPLRHDALCAAAELILALESAAKSTGAIDSVGTVGICDVFPGAINSVPSHVRLEVDIRDTEEQRRDTILFELKEKADEISKRRQLQIRFEPINADPPATCDPEILDAIEQTANSAGLTHRRIVSRAYHDSLFVARFAPVAMIFIPCRGGVSHRPDEYVSPEAIAKGVRVLAATLFHLAT